MLAVQTVAHAFNYERCLTFHLSALYLHPPQTCRVTATIFHAPPADDAPTSAILAYFAALPPPANVTLDFRELPPAQLCRRAIGRNLAARATAADFVLFSDVDYLFGENAIDCAAQAMQAACASGPKVMHVRELRSSIDHPAGDAELARVDLDRLELVEPLPERYTTSGLHTAIGGSQYIPGDLARAKGYLPEGHRFLREADGWKRTFCDRAARGWWEAPVVAINVPNVWRIRHGKRGRTDHGCRN